MDELTLDEMLKLAAKVEKWDRNPNWRLKYCGHIDNDITVELRGETGLFQFWKITRAGINIKTGNLKLEEYSLSEDLDIIEAYNHAKKSYEERIEREKQEKKEKALGKIKELLKNGRTNT